MPSCRVKQSKPHYAALRSTCSCPENAELVLSLLFDRSICVAAIRKLNLSRNQGHVLLRIERKASDSQFASELRQQPLSYLSVNLAATFVTNVPCERFTRASSIRSSTKVNRAGTIREAWSPQTKEDRENVLLELQRICASPHFCNSKRYPALLHYIVEATLGGRSDSLKERTLGVEVFDRSPHYDTNADTVVRYTAGEVRKRLSLYYHELDHKPTIQILLPVGSYVPELLHSYGDPEEEIQPPVSVHPSEVSYADLTPPPRHDPAPIFVPPVDLRRTRISRRTLIALSLSLTAVIALVIGLRYHVVAKASPVDDFWAPLLHDHRSVLVCSGGVVFKSGNFSGVVTAGKDIEYPFISSQIASAISRVSGLVERHGSTVDLQFSASTPITVLREQPLVLLGGYNNLWTIRLLDSLPFRFTPEPDGASIIEAAQPTHRWARDSSQSYASADDYALVARFRNVTTDSWVIVIAGLGRNGTEAASQVATSSHYMQLLRDQLGSDFANKNIEALLKVNVIDGKTGAPTILASRAW